MWHNMKREDTGVIQNNKDETSTCLKDIEIYIPVRFEQVGLTIIGTNVKTIGIFAINHGNNKYKVLLIPTFLSFVPEATRKENVDGTEFYVFSISKGSPFSNRRLLQDDGGVKVIIEETLTKGNNPDYLSYEGVGEIFDGFYEYIGSSIADDIPIVDVFISLAARTERDYKTHWRLAKPTDKIKWIGIANVALSRGDGFNRLTGAYLREGIVASSLDEIDTPTDLEIILKGKTNG